MIHITYATKQVIDRWATGRALYEARKQAGLTQEVLADRAGYTKQYISQLEQGVHNFQTETIQKIERALEQK